MKTIHIDFDGFWQPFDKEDNYFTNLIRKKFNVIIDTNKPDYIFYSCFNPDYEREGIKIFFTGENVRVDFNRFDYGIGFDHLTFGDRYIRWPLYKIYGPNLDKLNGEYYRSLLAQKKCFTIDDIKDKGFCSLVTSNTGDRADPARERFFKRLSEYKQVDSGGRALNNIGAPVQNKMQFISKYKFNIAFENSSTPGYTTEKFIEAAYADTLPVYYGNPIIEKDINLNSIIYLESLDYIDSIIEEVIKLDNDDELYLNRLNQPWFSPEKNQSTEENLLTFFENIFNQDLKLSLIHI